MTNGVLIKGKQRMFLERQVKIVVNSRGSMPEDIMKLRLLMMRMRMES